MKTAHWMAVVAVAAAAATGGATVTRGQAERVPNTYVGTQNCVTCHIDYARQWAELKHSKALTRPGRPAAQSGCEACHGPGGRHGARREWRGEIISWKGMSPEQQVGSCLRCHQGRVDMAQWRGSPHSKMGVSCLYCHEVHKSTGVAGNLQKPQTDLCGGCHAQLADSIKAGKHHPVPKGLVCSACHDPHNAARPKLLRADRKVLCVKCHAPNGGRVRPSSHNVGIWAKEHGKTAKVDSTRCDTCHSREEFCNACHGGVAMPHPAEWSMKHGEPAGKNPASCANCHDEKKCGVCHEQMPPSSHGQEGFRKKHGAGAKGNEALCNLCHGQESCNKCHGTPMPHAENWVMEHKGKGASFAADSLCLKCHKKETFCVTCHPGK